MSSEPQAPAALPVRWRPLLPEAGRAAAEPAPPRPGAVPPGAEAARLLAAARAEATEVLSEARRRCVALEAEARAQGHAAGWAEGLAEGRRRAEAEARGLLTEALRTRQRALAERRRLLDAVEGEVAALVLAVAQRILQREVEQAPEGVVALVRDLCRRAEGPAVARVHPGLAPMLEAEAAGLALPLTVRPDATVSPGGVILETAEGLLDATLEGRLERLGQALRGGDADGV